ncbi:MAG: hypothetical protein ACM65L_01420 [Microcoleus sp.]
MGHDGYAIDWRSGLMLCYSIAIKEVKALLEYLCQQSGKLYNSGVYKELCDLHGIRFVETEEAYTSKASFLDGDSLPKYGEKPSGWKASGKRIKRGLYQSANGRVVNADLNGAANILRKVASRLGVDLSRLGRRCLTNVARVRLWVLPKPTLSAESQRMKDLRVSILENFVFMSLSVGFNRL